MYKMQPTKDTVYAEIGGTLYRIRVYEVVGGYSDSFTVCCDGGEMWDRAMFGADRYSVWYYCGEMYLDKYKPSRHLGRQVSPDEIDDSLIQSIVGRLDCGEEDDRGLRACENCGEWFATDEFSGYSCEKCAPSFDDEEGEGESE